MPAVRAIRARHYILSGALQNATIQDVLSATLKLSPASGRGEARKSGPEVSATDLLPIGRTTPVVYVVFGSDLPMNEVYAAAWLRGS